MSSNYLNSETHKQFTEANVKNKGFIVLDELFKTHSWSLITNEMDHITYAKSYMDPNIFDIKVEKASVSVTVPLKNSNFLYTTTFSNYFEASEYVEERLNDYLS